MHTFMGALLIFVELGINGYKAGYMIDPSLYSHIVVMCFQAKSAPVSDDVLQGNTHVYTYFFI